MSTFNPESSDRFVAQNADPADSYMVFATICTRDGSECLGQVTNNAMILSTLGAVVREHWLRITQIFPFVLHDAFAIMPNHVHAILRVVDGRQLAEVLRWFVETTTQESKRVEGWANRRLWEPDYRSYELRSMIALNAARRFVLDNPKRWDCDQFNPKKIGADPLAKQLLKTLQAQQKDAASQPPPAEETHRHKTIGLSPDDWSLELQGIPQALHTTAEEIRLQQESRSQRRNRRIGTRGRTKRITSKQNPAELYYDRSELETPQSGTSTLPKNPLSRKGRVDPEELGKCRHGVAHSQICAICEPERFREVNGDR